MADGYQRSAGGGITSAPLITGNTVVVSTMPGNLEAFYQEGRRGVVHGLDVMTGDVRWYFDTTADNLWGNFRVNSGGGLSHPPSVDEAGNLYLGTGNAAPFPGTKEFPGGRDVGPPRRIPPTRRPSRPPSL